MRNILITKEMPDDILSMLAGRFPGCRFEMPGRPYPDEVVRTAEIIFGWVDRALLERAVSLKWFHSVSAGVDTFIEDADSLRGGDLLISCSAGIYGVPISEHLLAMMLALSHRIGQSVLNIPQGKWGGVPPCTEVHESTVGIVGYGDIGSHLASLLAPFRCKVLAFKRTPVEKPELASEMLYGDEGLDELMRRSDHVCVCLPGTPATRGLIDRRRIGLMKPSSTLLNIGRGYVVDTKALADALESGSIAGAGLDVTDPEPLPPGHRLWRLPSVIITPHISGYTPQQWENRAAGFFALNLEAYLQGSPLPGLIDRVHKY